MSEFFSFLIICDSIWTSYSTITHYTNPQNIAAKKGSSGMVVTTCLLVAVGNLVNLLGTRSRAKINIRILANLDIAHKLLFKNKQRKSGFRSLYFLVLFVNAICIYTVFAVFPRLEKRLNYNYCLIYLRAFLIFAKFSAVSVQ